METVKEYCARKESEEYENEQKDKKKIKGCDIMVKEYYLNGILKSCMLSELIPISPDQWNKVHEDFNKRIREGLKDVIL